MKFNLILILVFVGLFNVLNAQDERFSQFFAIPIHMNPALAGAYDGTYRMTVIHRDQWNNNLETPYKTFAAGGDTRFNLDFNSARKDHVGIGLFFTSDRVAEFQANTNKISGYFAYHKKLTERNPSFIGGGIKVGVIQKNINYDNITFQDQFNQINAFDNPTQETLPPNNIGFFDVSLGLNYFINVNKTAKYYVGFAAHHLTNPNVSLFARLENPNPNLDLSETLESKYVFHMSMDRKLNITTEIQPRIIYQKQGENNQLSIGSNVQHNFKDSNTGLVFGLWTSGKQDLESFHLESITPLLGVIQGAFIFGFSYDIPLTDTFSDPFGLNTFEFSIRFSGEHENETTFCPTF
ncbi:MAG: PorP/SprF family type IX secretion system membrane protein [Saprospiraceae bacterium]|nr:PorP/SprF family type IX secretion system membrane protein [Bacteroidia bacterium]NNE14971.1 PorP/SprF family type IX secretion system membrane protein [Saprospiraceae bacterium]NNL92191.1 PorP/SprF family type IX secretion system membrane protein [Saprospiraceae bacterium]